MVHYKLLQRTVCTTSTYNQKSNVRIGCASGFWGDSAVASRQLVQKGKIDYLVFDYLSEITMSLLTAAKRKNPDFGYAPDFVAAAMKPNLKSISKNGIKVISNAGGINPKACSAELQRVAEQQGIKLEIATVTGDDMMSLMKSIRESVKEMGSGKALPDARFVSMNAYFGAEPIKRALDLGAQIVVTGRCVDSAVVLAPLMHEFNWSPSDYDRLAAGSLAGHLVECGAQSTGGIFTDWQTVDGWDNIGFPIVDCKEDGTFTLTKPPGTGGLVTPATVAEQLTYEIGDPSAYVLPDVTCDFRNVNITPVEEGESVKVVGAKGRPPTDSFKVCATYLDGNRITAVCCVGGKRAIAKAHKTANAIISRVRGIFKALGMADFKRVYVQAIGDEAPYGKYARKYGLNGEGPRETAIWMALEHDDKMALQIFANEIAPAGTGMAPGLSAIIGGRPKPSPILKLFSFLHPKKDLNASVYLGDKFAEEIKFSDMESSGVETSTEDNSIIKNVPTGTKTYILEDLAYTRSGDKGNSANIGVIARNPSFVTYLEKYLTQEAVFEYFQHLFDSSNMPENPVIRYKLPGINGFNFVLTDCLGGGGVTSLRPDPQGKALGQMLLDFEFNNMPDLEL
uniref:uncharacterized protein LOC120329525 n=1 Tax=Styela clava TaxID=7725 RepID=UPI0019398D3F|nr:uncharacterized protein LOC120329525 [Styela clava]